MLSLPFLYRSLLCAPLLMALWLALPVAAEPDALHGPSVGMRAIGGDRYEVTLRYKPASAVQSVHLAGSFNQWSNTALPMHRDEASGAYFATLQLAGGEYTYKFVVDKAKWVADPENSLSQPDGHGGGNSLLRVGVLARVGESRARRGDTRVAADAMLHDPELPVFLLPGSAGSVRLRVLTAANDAEKVELLRPQAGDLGWAAYPTKLIYTDPKFDYYETTLTLAEGEPLQYAFRASDGRDVVLLDAQGTRPALDPKPAVPFEPVVGGKDIFAPPAWAADMVWYQVLPDRFRDGAPENNPKELFPWLQNWHTPAPFEGKGGTTFYESYAYERFLGGDIQGVIAQLDYLHQLGISGLYLQPVFRSQSYHGYDVIDYRHVEDRLAIRGSSEAIAKEEDLLDATTWKWSDSDRVLIKLIEEAHRRGMRVVLDVPFNHMGNESLAFRDLVERGRRSRFANWFEITSWEPLEYKGWRGFGKLPELAETPEGFADETLTQHFFDITRRWMDPNGDGNPADGIDGWRLDASDDVSPAFWAAWRAHVKSINPQALIIGEWWGRADSMLGAHGFDGVTNYQIGILIHQWIVNGGTPRGLTPSAFDRALAELRFAYPEQAQSVMFNILDSHDTDRALSMMFNPGRDYDRQNKPQSDAPNYKEQRPDALARRKLKLAATFLATYIGAPVVFQGTEIGIFGADDPNNRKPMWWKDLGTPGNPDYVADEDLLAWYQRLHALRNTYGHLRTGAYATRLVDDKKGIFAFSRQGKDACAVIILNNSDKEQNVLVPTDGLTDGIGAVKTWHEALNGRSVLINQRVEGGQGFRRVLRLENPPPVRTRVDRTLEVQIPAHSAMVYVSAGQ